MTRKIKEQWVSIVKKRSWNSRKRDTKRQKLRIDENRMLCIGKQEENKIPNMVSIQFRHLRFTFQELDNR